MHECLSILEQLSLPIEKRLWKLIMGNERIDPAGKFQVLVLGTDRKLSLPREILSHCPQAEILVVEKDLYVAETAKKIIEKRENKPDGVLQILHGEFPNVLLPENFSPRLVIAKHLIHLLPPESLKGFVESVMTLVSDGETFYASTPSVFDWITIYNLKHNAISFYTLPMGFLNGTVFLFQEKHIII
jgi:hypothetical protein